MSPVLSIAMNDLKLLLRNRTACFFTVIFPVIFGLGFGFIFKATMSGGGGDARIEIAVVDLDHSDVSQAFIDALKDTGDIDVAMVDSEEQAATDVRSGRYAASVVVPEGFSEGMDSVFTGGGLEIRGVVDPSRAAESAMVEGLAQAAGFRALASGFTDPGRSIRMLGQGRQTLRDSEGGNPLQRALLDQVLAGAERFMQNEQAAESGDTNGEAGLVQGEPAASFSPITTSFTSAAIQTDDTGPHLDSAFQITFPQAATWGLVGCVTGFGLSLVSERSAGTLVRLRSAPIRGLDVLLGKSLACFLMAVFVMCLTLAVFAPLGVRVPAPLKLGAVFLATAWAFVGIMAVLATVSKSEQGTEGFVRAVLLIMALVGGAGIPKFFLEQVHPWLPYVSPIGWTISGLEGATWRQFTWAQLALPIAVLTGIGAVCFTLGVRFFGRWHR